MSHCDKIDFDPLRLAANLKCYADCASFYHSGDLGDVIFSLPTVRALGGGVLVLGPEMCTPVKARVPVNSIAFRNIAPLLAEQPYLRKVIYSECMPEGIRYDLNEWRLLYFHLRGHPSVADSKNLCRAHLAAFGLDHSHEQLKWMHVDHPVAAAEVICNRNLRCPNPKFPWPKILATYKGKTAFVGTSKEYLQFCTEFGEIPYVKTVSLLDVARVIAGCRLFVGNQSCPYAIAEGLKVNAIQEVYPEYPCCQFERPNLVLGWDERIVLPEL
jgi:ADP-heptose:LPS heptosyltransferase